MANIAARIIRESVGRIMAAMKEGVFSREDLEALKRVFEEGAKATQASLDRGPKDGAGTNGS